MLHAEIPVAKVDVGDHAKVESEMSKKIRDMQKDAEVPQNESLMVGGEDAENDILEKLRHRQSQVEIDDAKVDTGDHAKVESEMSKKIRDMQKDVVVSGALIGTGDEMQVESDITGEKRNAFPPSDGKDIVKIVNDAEDKMNALRLR